MIDAQENSVIAPEWAEKEVNLSWIKPFEHNPRRVSEAEYEKLKKSIVKHGQFKPLLVTADLRLAGGHQRLKIMKELGWTTCRVSFPKVEITDEHYKELVLLDNHNNGLWDDDVLANFFELEMIHDVGLHDFLGIRPDEAAQPGKKLVKCPNCGECFPAKGNGVSNEQGNH